MDSEKARLALNFVDSGHARFSQPIKHPNSGSGNVFDNQVPAGWSFHIVLCVENEPGQNGGPGSETAGRSPPGPAIRDGPGCRVDPDWISFIIGRNRTVKWVIGVYKCRCASRANTVTSYESACFSR